MTHIQTSQGPPRGSVRDEGDFNTDPCKPRLVSLTLCVEDSLSSQAGELTANCAVTCRQGDKDPLPSRNLSSEGLWANEETDAGRVRGDQTLPFCWGAIL